MKHIFFTVFLFVCVVISRAQTERTAETVVITSNHKKTRIHTNENGSLQVNVSRKDAREHKERGWVRYSDFGAKGDGKTDDIDAIAATHAFANQQNLLVKADDGATYYIGGKERTAIIRTDTEFGTAHFIIDDTEVRNRNASVFMVSSISDR